MQDNSTRPDCGNKCNRGGTKMKNLKNKNDRTGFTKSSKDIARRLRWNKEEHCRCDEDNICLRHAMMIIDGKVDGIRKKD